MSTEAFAIVPKTFCELRCLDTQNSILRSDFGDSTVAALSLRSAAPRPIFIRIDIGGGQNVFRQLSAAYAEVASRTTLYVSKRDQAVEAPPWLHHFARAGLLPPTLVLPGPTRSM
jgi:hypothetical protein